jgi:hypothetical protein
MAPYVFVLLGTMFLFVVPPILAACRSPREEWVWRRGLATAATAAIIAAVSWIGALWLVGEPADVMWVVAVTVLVGPVALVCGVVGAIWARRRAFTAALAVTTAFPVSFLALVVGLPLGTSVFFTLDGAVSTAIAARCDAAVAGVQPGMAAAEALDGLDDGILGLGLLDPRYLHLWTGDTPVDSCSDDSRAKSTTGRSVWLSCTRYRFAICDARLETVRYRVDFDGDTVACVTRYEYAVEPECDCMRGCARR